MLAVRDKVESKSRLSQPWYTAEFKYNGKSLRVLSLRVLYFNLHVKNHSSFYVKNRLKGNRSGSNEIS